MTNLQEKYNAAIDQIVDEAYQVIDTVESKSPLKASILRASMHDLIIRTTIKTLDYAIEVNEGGNETK